MLKLTNLSLKVKISRPSVPESFSIDERTTKFRLDVKVMDEHDEIEMADVDDEDATERKVDLQQRCSRITKD